MSCVRVFHPGFTPTLGKNKQCYTVALFWGSRPHDLRPNAWPRNLLAPNAEATVNHLTQGHLLVRRSRAILRCQPCDPGITGPFQSTGTQCRQVDIDAKPNTKPTEGGKPKNDAKRHSGANRNNRGGPPQGAKPNNGAKPNSSAQQNLGATPRTSSGTNLHCGAKSPSGARHSRAMPNDSAKPKHGTKRRKAQQRCGAE